LFFQGIFFLRNTIPRNFFLIICLHFESLFNIKIKFSFSKISKIHFASSWRKIFLFLNVKKVYVVKNNLEEKYQKSALLRLEVRFSFSKILKKPFYYIFLQNVWKINKKRKYFWTIL
jgi:hypothetical protein